MHPLISYLIGLLPAGFLMLLLVIHYERQLKINRQERGNLQKNLNDVLSKMMAVDYEKLREIELRAHADAQVAYEKAVITDEYEMIQEPKEVEVRRAYPTS